MSAACILLGHFTQLRILLSTFDCSTTLNVLNGHDITYRQDVTVPYNSGWAFSSQSIGLFVVPRVFESRIVKLIVRSCDPEPWTMNHEPYLGYYGLRLLVDRSWPTEYYFSTFLSLLTMQLYATIECLSFCLPSSFSSCCLSSLYLYYLYSFLFPPTPTSEFGSVPKTLLIKFH